MSDVFVSYKREDRARVKPLVDALAAEGLSVWWDVGIEAGSAWRRSIETALDGAKCVIVVWSELSVGPAGEFVHDEAGVAKQRGIYLPVRIDDVAPPLGFRQVQALSLIGWRGRPGVPAFKELLAGARKIIAGVRAMDAAPVAGAGPTFAHKGGWLRVRQLAVAAAAVTIVAVAALWFAIGRPGWPRPDARVAVMPIETIGADASARAFATEVSAEIAGVLARNDLRPISADAIAGLHGAERETAVTRLGAAFVLGGQVEATEGALDLQVSLRDAREHLVLWSASFVRPVSQVQAMQQQVGVKIADVLKCALDTHNFQGGRIDTQTVGLYLRACDLGHDQGAWDQVRDLYREVAERQPNFAAAWSNLAVSDALAADSLPPDQAASARREARDAAQRALRLDPKDSAAYMALSDLVPQPGHLIERNALVVRGISVGRNENADLDDREAQILAEAGRLREAEQVARREVSLDPLSPIKTATLMGILAYEGRVSEAETVGDKAARIWPDDASIAASRFSIEVRAGDPGRALALLDNPKTRPADMEPERLGEWRRFNSARKGKDPALASAFAHAELAGLAAGRLSATRALLDLTGVGATDAAFAAAARSTAATPIDSTVLFRPAAAAMRRDPRFMPLAAALGLVEFWRVTGKWPDFCNAPDRPYDCRSQAAKAH